MRWGSADFQGWLQRGTAALASQEQAINAINIYPVADCDTGSNMLCTWRLAAAAIHADSLGDAAHEAAMAALREGRGNSGMVLAAALIGLAKSWRGCRETDGAGFADAWQTASREGWTSVFNPTPGTIVSALEEVADSISALVAEAPYSMFVARMVYAARRAVASSPTRLPALQAAGVVDAGALGLLVLIEQLATTDRLQPVHP